MSIYHVIISIPLFMVLAFGIGFFVNMLVKTTWLPMMLYLGVVGYLFFDVGGSFSPVDMVILSAGMVGAVFSGTVIRSLRLRGYRMF